jgi:hypothetical protein
MDIEWLDPWYPTDQAGLVEQLRAEMGPGHILETEPEIRAVARRDDSDDALFALADGRVAEVHLTWRRSRETDSRWPLTAIFGSLAEWGRESMEPLQQKFTASGR